MTTSIQSSKSGCFTLVNRSLEWPWTMDIPDNQERLVSTRDGEIKVAVDDTIMKSLLHIASVISEDALDTEHLAYLRRPIDISIPFFLEKHGFPLKWVQVMELETRRCWLSRVYFTETGVDVIKNHIFPKWKRKIAVEENGNAVHRERVNFCNVIEACSAFRVPGLRLVLTSFYCGLAHSLLMARVSK